MKRYYFDNAATTCPDEDVIAYMQRFYAHEYANPGSQHSFGRNAKKALENARKQIADSIGADESEIVFTSGGTESDNTALFGSVKAGDHIIVSSIEHHAVLNTAKSLEQSGVSVTYLPVNADGVAQLSELETAFRCETKLVSVMYANNETGAVQPIKEMAALAHKHGCLFHTDAVQAVGVLPLNVEELGVDLLSVSAHKFYAPRGCGFLYCKGNVRLEPRMLGGDQEGKRRAGTENLPSICAMAYAFCRAQKDREKTAEKTMELRNRFEKELVKLVQGITVNSAGTERLPGISNMIFHGVRNQFLLASLDINGVMASGGAACTAGSLEPSHVLLAMGIEAQKANEAVRFSFGKNNNAEEIENAVRIIAETVNNLRKPKTLFADQSVNVRV